MRERPIIFSGEMVKAILEGRKTQTRRILKLNREVPRLSISDDVFKANMTKCPEFCPYGQVGERLWVRETHKLWVPDCMGDEGDSWSVTYKDGEHRDNLATFCENDTYDGARDLGLDKEPIRWRPSIHMPKWAARIWLEITGVRVERVQDISEDDAIAEGIKRFEVGPPWGRTILYATEWPNPVCGDMAYYAFADLWDSLNAKQGYGWSTNCWVWCLSFKILTLQEGG